MFCRKQFWIICCYCPIYSVISSLKEDFDTSDILMLIGATILLMIFLCVLVLSLYVKAFRQEEHQDTDLEKSNNDKDKDNVNRE